ncbi:MAG TPA: transposase [Pirellulales bacterium]|jgi:REP element-mobilizing transposase RayT
MPRIARYAPKGWVYHALNRAVARLPLFQKDTDYEAFERVVGEAHERLPIEIFAYCVRPNHWHFLLRPTKDGQWTAFLRCLAHTHTRRWHAHHHTSGTGHLYQGRFKAFPVEDDDHFYTVARYGERNALRRADRRGGSVALVEFVAAHFGRRGVTGSVIALACFATARLDRTCQRAANRRGVGGGASRRASQQPVRPTRMAKEDRRAAWLASDAAPPRPAS